MISNRLYRTQHGEHKSSYQTVFETRQPSGNISSMSQMNLLEIWMFVFLAAGGDAETNRNWQFQETVASISVLNCLLLDWTSN